MKLVDDASSTAGHCKALISEHLFSWTSTSFNCSISSSVNGMSGPESVSGEDYQLCAIASRM